MRQDELIQELRSYNKELIKYLTKDDVMSQMFKLAITPTDSKEEEVIYRVPCNATEVICSRNKDIEKTLAKNGAKYIPVVLEYIKQDKLPDDKLSGYFSKLVSNFVRANPEDMKSYLKTYDFLPCFLGHLESFEVMDALRVIFDLPYKENETDYWWNDSHKAINEIIVAYEKSPKVDEQYYYDNYRELICSLIQRGFTKLYIIIYIIDLIQIHQHHMHQHHYYVKQIIQKD